MEDGENPKSKSANTPFSCVIAESVEYPGVGVIQSNDLKVENSLGLIVHASFGTLIRLRGELEQMLGRRAFIFGTISAKPLFVVHWEDLSEEKKKAMGEKRF